MANPRKFSEKIALHHQKQAEETAAFEEIMREVSNATKEKVRCQWNYYHFFFLSAISDRYPLHTFCLPLAFVYVGYHMIFTWICQLFDRVCITYDKQTHLSTGTLEQ